MKLWYDFHIHSCLSPCADDDMTPNNVCGMAALKQLDAIALTDHNSARNLRAFSMAAKEYGLLFVPGIEICTKEEVHLLGYFPTVEAAEEAGEICTAHLPAKKNIPDFFGNQLLMDHEDKVVGTDSSLLIGAVSLDLSQVCAMVRSFGGVPVPAHIFRRNGIMEMLGFIPPSEGFRTVEKKPGDAAITGDYRFLSSSDAHRLGDISEQTAFIETDAEIGKILAWMRGA